MVCVCVGGGGGGGSIGTSGSIVVYFICYEWIQISRNARIHGNVFTLSVYITRQLQQSLKLQMVQTRALNL